MKLPRGHHLTAEQIAGQLILASIHLNEVNRDGPTIKKARLLVETFGIGGFLIESGTPAALRFFTHYMNNCSPLPLFFAVELSDEFLLGALGTTPLPSLLQLGAAHSRELLEAYARVVSDELRAMGINVAFLPLLNIANVDAEHPAVPHAVHWDSNFIRDSILIFDTTFRQKGIVPVFQFIPPLKGLKENSVLQPINEILADIWESWVRYFPDKHHYPMAIALAPALDSTTAQPIIFNEAFIWHFKDRTRFTGVLCTHRLDALSSQNLFSSVEWHTRPISAGVHWLVTPWLPEVAVSQLVYSINKEPQFARNAQRAVDSLFRLKKWIHAHQPKQPHPYRVFKKIQHPEHIHLARTIAAQGAVALQIGKHFPWQPGHVQQILHLIFSNASTAAGILDIFNQELQKRYANIIVRVNPTPDQISDIPLDSGVRVIFSLIFTGIEQNRFQEVQETLEQLLAAISRKNGNSIWIFWGFNLHLIRSPIAEQADSILLFQDTMPPTQVEASRLVSGLYPITGTLPVSAQDGRVPSVRYDGVLLQIKKNQPLMKDSDQFFNKPFWKNRPHWVISNSHIIHQTIPEETLWRVTPEMPLLFRFLVTGPLTLLALRQRWFTPQTPIHDLLPIAISETKAPIIIDSLLNYRLEWEPDVAIPTDSPWEMLSNNPIHLSENRLPDFRTEILLFSFLKFLFRDDFFTPLQQWYQTAIFPLTESPVTLHQDGDHLLVSPSVVQSLAQLLLNEGWGIQDRVISFSEWEWLFQRFGWGLTQVLLQSPVSPDQTSAVSCFILNDKIGRLILIPTRRTQIFLAPPHESPADSSEWQTEILQWLRAIE